MLRLTAAGGLLRDLPLFFRAAPRTPLRVLGIIALDTLHILRHSQPMSRQRVSELAMFLDLQGCANATWDRKARCEAEYAAIQRRLEQADLGPRMDDYLSRLRELENRRPAIGGDHDRFDQVREYREAVARLAITTAAALALNDAINRDPDVEVLFRILMQCQIIDDVMDYREDRSAGLPSFMTAAASLSQARQLTAGAARHYAVSSGEAPGQAVFPLRLALWVVSAVARLVVWVGAKK